MNREIIASFFRMNPETILGNKPLSPGPFGLCPRCHDAFCDGDEPACPECLAADAAKDQP